MTEVIFVITLVFTKWDDCWSYYHRMPPNEVRYLEMKCEEHRRFKSLAPTTSPRPKGRDDE